MTLLRSLVRVIDTAAFGSEETVVRAAIAFLSSLCGMIVVATLIGSRLPLLAPADSDLI